MDTPTKDQLVELTEVIEDTVQYFCDKHTQSGQLAWTVLHCLSLAKMCEFEEPTI